MDFNKDMPDDMLSYTKALLDNFPVFVLFIDGSSDVVISSNNPAKKILGDIDGKHLKSIFTDEWIAADSNSDAADLRTDYSTSINGKWFRLSKINAISEAAATAYVLVGIDITEMIKSEKQLKENVYTDKMTGIYNRNGGLSLLQKQISEVKTGGEFTVCYIDMNGLKKINDTYGHKEGDDYIMAVITTIKNSVRQSDIFARLGGDEFIVIFPHCSMRIVENIMASVNKKLETKSQSAANDVRYSISYGVMEVNSETNLDMEQILNYVDNKMYYMKEEYYRSIETENKNG